MAEAEQLHAHKNAVTLRLGMVTAKHLQATTEITSETAQKKKKVMKDFDLQSWVRPNIWALKPYSSARDEFQGMMASCLMLMRTRSAKRIAIPTHTNVS